MMAFTFQCPSFCGSADGAYPLLFPSFTIGIYSSDPTSIVVVMVITQIVLQQDISNGIGHHLMTDCTGMGTVTTKFIDIVIHCTVIIQAADQVEIYYRDIIQGTDLNNRITEVPECVAIYVRLVLIPIPVITGVTK